MEQAAQGAQSGQEGLSQQSLQRLAELLRKAGKNGASQASRGKGSNGPPMTEQQLQDLLNSLENMKEGVAARRWTRQPRPGQRAIAGVGGGAFARKRGDGQSAGDKPSGMPGGEHDQGTNEHLFADKPPDGPKAEGNAPADRGRAGGTARRCRSSSARRAARPRASRQYRDLYEAIAPAEQNSVEQEAIPLGSRHLVRRYFENIRPQN